MRFVYPGFLWALLLLAIPVLIHLFSFRKIKQLYFPSLQFIQHVEQESRSTKKLKHLLILLSRILAFIALVLAFAQPYLPSASAKSANGKPVLAVYIDNSLSMTAKGSNGELISEAAEIARGIIQQVDRSTRILISTNEMTGADARLLTKEQALDRIDKLEVSGFSKSPAEVITWQKACIQREHETTERLGQVQFVAISDFQKNSLQSITKIQQDENYVYPIKLSPEVTENLSIDSVWFDTPVHRKGSQNAVRVRVRNYSTQPIKNLDVSMQLGSISRSLFLDVPANKTAELTFQYTETQTGSQQGKVSINDKRVLWDDDYFFSYQAFTACSVLVVSSTSASLCQAIYKLEPYYKVSTCSPESINSNQLEGIELVVLDGVTRLSSGANSALTRYSEAGGAVCFIPDQEVDLLSCNYLLRNLGLPALGDKTSSGVSISRLHDEAPFFRGVFDKKIGRVSYPTIKSCFRTLTTNKSSYLPLITLQNGSYLLAQSANGKRNFLLSIPLNEGCGSFTKDALFPTIMLRIGELGKASLPTSLTLGNESFIQLNTRLSEDQVIRMQRDSTTFIPKRNRTANGEILFFSGEEALEYLTPGAYTLTAQDEIGYISFNYSRQESDPSYADQDAIQTYFKNCGIDRVIYKEQVLDQNLPPIDVEKPYAYWRICIVLALIFVFAEMALVLFWKK